LKVNLNFARDLNAVFHADAHSSSEEVVDSPEVGATAADCATQFREFAAHSGCEAPRAVHFLNNEELVTEPKNDGQLLQPSKLANKNASKQQPYPVEGPQPALNPYGETAAFETPSRPRIGELNAGPQATNHASIKPVAVFLSRTQTKKVNKFHAATSSAAEQTNLEQLEQAASQADPNAKGHADKDCPAKIQAIVTADVSALDKTDRHAGSATVAECPSHEQPNHSEHASCEAGSPASAATEQGELLNDSFPPKVGHSEQPGQKGESNFVVNTSATQAEVEEFGTLELKDVGVQAIHGKAESRSRSWCQEAFSAPVDARAT
jgi:hypothetical protein